jgi:hypothetical protein
MKSLVVHPENKEQLDALKKLFKTFNISFDIKKTVKKQKVDKVKDDDNIERLLT